MKTKKTLGWIAALSMCVGSLSFGACSQPKPECQVALASTTYAYAVRYKLKAPASAACADRVLPGDTFGMEFYHPPTADGKTYDQTKTTFAIQSETLGGEARSRESAAANVAAAGLGCDGDPNPCLDNNADHHVYAMGTFVSSDPDDKDMCTGEFKVTEAATMEFPAIPEIPSTGDDDPGQEARPAATYKFEWSNVKFYVTAAVPGTQFSGDLKYTVDDCSFDYQVVGMWPAVYCGGYDDNGDPTYEDPSDAACNPCAAKDAVAGSGISPDFATKCDPDLFVCTLRNAKDKTSDATSIPQLLDTPVDCGEVN